MHPPPLQDRQAWQETSSQHRLEEHQRDGNYAPESCNDVNRISPGMQGADRGKTNRNCLTKSWNNLWHLQSELAVLVCECSPMTVRIALMTFGGVCPNLDTLPGKQFAITCSAKTEKVVLATTLT